MHNCTRANGSGGVSREGDLPKRNEILLKDKRERRAVRIYPKHNKFVAKTIFLVFDCVQWK